tara:strand:+ start:949 stop:1395 length:447 start_codon:yes stop_codon:yes gene_type:complete
MSKLSRTVLKEIVKECLVEILSEGLASPVSSTPRIQETVQRKRKKKQNIQQTQKNRYSYLDNIKFGQHEQKKQKNNVKTNITNDPIMNELLADTAVSTLKEQVSAERNKGSAAIAVQGDHASRVVDKSNPEDLFGSETASKWASLAFG